MTEALRADASDLKPAAQILGYPVCDYLGMKDNFGREMEASAKLIFEQSAEALFGNREITDELLRREAFTERQQFHTADFSMEYL